MVSSGSGHTKRIGLGLLLATLLMLIIGGVALAVSFTASILVTEGNGTAYPMLAINTSNNNTYLSANGFTTANMTDVNIEIVANEYPRMLTDNMTFFAVPINANSSTTYYYVTDQTPNDFAVIAGHDGYVTAEDKPNLEGAANFTIQQTGWVDFTADGTSANLTTKQGAISVYRSSTVSGKVTAEFFSATTSSNITPTSHSASAEWLNPLNAYDGSTITLAQDDDVAGGAYSDYFSFSYTSNISFQEIEVWKDNTTNSNIDVDVWIGGAWVHAYDAAKVDGAWQTVDLGTVYYTDTLRVRLKNGAGGAQSMRLYEIRFHSRTLVSVSASGLSSADTTVTVNATANRQSWATGNVLSFDGADDVVNCGSGATLDALTGSMTIDTWIKPNSAGEGSSGRVFELNKITLNVGANQRAAFNIIVGAVNRTATSAINSVPYGSWTHVVGVFNGVNVLIYTNTTLVTGNLTAGPIDAHAADILYLGDTGGSTRCFDGLIGVVRVYNRALGLAEITAHYNGDYSDRTGLVGEWYLDEGAGTNIPDYSGNSNTGTLTNGAWQTSTYTTGKTGRLCDFTLQVGTHKWGKNLKGATIPNTATGWTFMQNNVMPYADSISVSVNGTQQLWYQPNHYIIGTNLPDRAADATSNPGTFHWGSMPAGVGATFGSMALTEEAYAAGAAVVPPSSLGIIGYGIPSIHVPDTSLTLPGHELYPVVNAVATLTDIPIVMYWWFIAALLALLALTFAGKFTQSVFVGGVAMVVVMAVFCVLGESSTATGGALEWWQPAVVVMGTIVTAVMERSQSF